MRCAGFDSVLGNDGEMRLNGRLPFVVLCKSIGEL
jgi:hypothetical protein